MHALARDLVDGFLGWQVYPVQVVDPAVRFVGGKERRLDRV